MEAAWVFYGMWGIIAFGLLIFLLTPAGKRWVKWLDEL